MSIAAKSMKPERGWILSKIDLAKKFGKSPSEITKWLSGNHNFTVDTLIEIERVLDIKLLAPEEKISNRNFSISQETG